MNALPTTIAVHAAGPTTIAPAVDLGTPALLFIAAAGIALLLVLIIRLKIQAFIALLVVSVLVAVATRIPLKDIFTVVSTGVGSTMGKVALLIALGAILGRMIEVSGGVQSLADHFTQRFGPRRVAVALTLVGFMVAVPVFFEVGVIVLVPIVYAFARLTGVHPIKYGLPMAGIMLAVHVSVPPHPGVVAGAGVLNADIGLITLISLLICIPLAALSYLVAAYLNRRDYPLLPQVRSQLDRGGADEKTDGGGSSSVAVMTQAPPRPALIVTLIAAPIVQILIGTLGTLTLDPDSGWYGAAAFIGNPFLALTIAVGLSFVFLGLRRGRTLADIGDIVEESLPPIAPILMVVAAGGIFGEVLRTSGIGTALADTLDQIGLPVLLLGFVISLALRAAQGSATVAIVTTTSLLSSAVLAAGYTPIQIALIVVAIGFGSLGLSHVTDAGFWTVVRYYGLTVADGLRTWTVLTTILGVAGFLLCSAAWFLVSAAGV